MRYWAYFAAKLIVAGGILYASLGLLNPLAPPDPEATAGAGVSKNPLGAPKIAASPAPGQTRSFSVAEPGAQIQVEIAPPEKNKTDGDAAKSMDTEEKTPELAPLSYGGQYLALNLALMVWFLFGAGMLYLIVYDQRYRCRVCLRRLRMPVETGSRGFMLQMGRPRTEYICPYGHGTLKQEEFQTSGLENPEWTAHTGDMWDELYAASKRDSEEE
jgi:hypothetical protein